MGDERGPRLQLDRLACLVVAIGAFGFGSAVASQTRHPIQVWILVLVLVPVLWAVVTALDLEFSRHRPFIRSTAHRKR